MRNKKKTLWFPIFPIAVETHPDYPGLVRARSSGLVSPHIVLLRQKAGSCAVSILRSRLLIHRARQLERGGISWTCERVQPPRWVCPTEESLRVGDVQMTSVVATRRLVPSPTISVPLRDWTGKRKYAPPCGKYPTSKYE